MGKKAGPENGIVPGCNLIPLFFFRIEGFFLLIVYDIVNRLLIENEIPFFNTRAGNMFQILL